MAIDTLKVARRLRDAGFSEPQAEAVVAAVQDGSEGADLVTKHDAAEQTALLKADIAEWRSDLRIEIAAVRSEMREMEQRLVARIEASKSEMVSRMFGMSIGAVLVNIVAMLGALFAFAKLLGH